MTNVLMLAAGKGSRFKHTTNFPKPFISINNEPMFVHALKGIGLKDVKYHFLFQETVAKKFQPEKYVDGTIHTIDAFTDGAASSAYKVLKNSPNIKQGWLIVDCDGIINWNKKFDCTQSGIFTDTHPWDPRSSYSYVDTDNNILCTAEKQCISRYRNTGQYYWNSGELFCECYEFYKHHNIQTLNEYYISTLYNVAIQLGETVKNIPVNRYDSVGTPDALELYLEKFLNENYSSQRKYTGYKTC